MNPSLPQRIPLQRPSVREEEIEAVRAVFDSRWLGLGTLVFKNISGRDFSPLPSYRVFPLRLVIRRTTQVGFRVRNKGDAVF